MAASLPKKFLSRYSQRARHVLARALSRPGEPHALDLLETIILEKGALGAQLLAAYGITEEAVARFRAHAGLNTAPEKQSGTQKITPLADDIKTILKRATSLASRHESIYIGTEHLVAALLEDKHLKNVLSRASSKQAIKELRQHLALLLANTPHLTHLTPMSTAEPETERAQVHQRKSLHGGKASPHETRVLPLFAEDMLERAKRGAFDPLIGREGEVERLITILSRRSKNNPLLIGEAGVGKTAIVEGLAQRMCEGNVPEHLSNKRLLALDLGLLIAGTVFRGEFEARLKDVIHEAEEENAILFIDEIHTLVGAGSAQGSLDAANMLKPAISADELQIIGATTINEYRTHLERDPALERRLQPIIVNESTADETRNIITGLRGQFEAYHRIAIPDEVIGVTVDLSSRYLTHRFFPDKAIDVLDEAAAHVRSTSRAGESSSRRVEKLKAALAEVRAKKEEAVGQEQYAAAISLKHEEEKLERSLRSLRHARKQNHEKNTRSLERADIERVVSRMAGVPLEEVTAPEKEKLLKLEKVIARHIVGQDHAIGTVATALRRARVGVSADTRPIGSFLFLGPSGVGKTELARVLAQTFFGRDDALIKLDMSEFSEPHTVSKLLGAPAGYIGYDDHGSFIERVRRHPHSLVLFDEVEKAHPHSHNILLQILEDGQLTSSHGARISFKNTLIVLTSNVGTDHFLGKGETGFGKEARNVRNTRVRSEVNELFRPELTSRIDEVVVFNSLGKREIEKIVRRELKKLSGRLGRKNVELSFESSLVRLVARQSHSRLHGARKVRTVVQRLIENDLATRMISGSLSTNRRIHIGVKDGKLTYT